MAVRLDAEVLILAAFTKALGLARTNLAPLKAYGLRRRKSSRAGVAIKLRQEHHSIKPAARRSRPGIGKGSRAAIAGEIREARLPTLSTQAGASLDAVALAAHGGNDENQSSVGEVQIELEHAGAVARVGACAELLKVAVTIPVGI
jgi:hypothetical protein